MKFLLALLLCASLATSALLLKERIGSSSSATGSAAPATTAASGKPSLAPSVQAWALLRDGDPAGLQRLRDLGLPEEMVRALARAAIDDRFRAREKALLSSIEPGNYWQRSYRPYINYADHLALQQEKTAAVKKLFGDDFRPPGDVIDARLAYLPAEKISKIRALEEDYSALNAGITATFTGGQLSGEARERLAYLEKEKRADLVALLTPRELEDYDLRASQTANMLRSQMAAFNPTEEEFRAFFRLQTSLSGGQPASSYDSAAYIAQANALNNAGEQIKQLLGETRYAEYQRSKDYEYRTLASIASRLQLPPEKAVEAFNFKNELEKKVRGFRPPARDGGPEAQKEYLELLTGILDEADAGLVHILGEKGAAAYREYSNAYGNLRNRVRPPATTPRPPGG